jgi:hypothetical protein
MKRKWNKIKDKIIVHLKSTSFLTLEIIFVGSGLSIIVFYIFHLIDGEKMPENHLGLAILVGSISFVISGIFSIKRREAKRVGLPNLKGFGAVVAGIITCIFFGGLTLLQLFVMIFSIK